MSDAKPRYLPIQWEPDADPSWLTNPGVLTEVKNLVPTIAGGYQNYVSGTSENFSTVLSYTASDVPNTAKIMKRIGIQWGQDAARFFVGCSTKLLEVKRTGTISDVSKAAAPYLSSEWAFDAYGDMMLAAAGNGDTTPNNQIQASTGAAFTAFSDLASSPKAAIVAVQKNFVIGYNVYDGTNYYNDGWMCSGLGNPTSWAANFSAGANVATQANYGRLLDTPGGIRAAHRMRDRVAVYKPDALYIAEYTGPITSSSPATWAHRLVSDKVGCSNHNGVAIVDGVHYFIHRNGVYRFDGSYPQNIGRGRVNRWLSSVQSRSALFNAPGFRTHVDEENGLIFWYMATNLTTGSLLITHALVYNYVSDKFGWIDRAWNEQDASDYFMLCPVMASRIDLRLWASAVDGRRDAKMLTIGSTGGTVYARGVCLGDSTRTLNTTASLATGDFGDDIQYAKIVAVKPRMLQGDDDAQSAVCYIDRKDSQADYYDQSGIQIQATATGTGSGSYAIVITPPDVTSRRTLASGDYLQFEGNLIQGNVATPFGVQLTIASVGAVDFPVTITAAGKWSVSLNNLAAYVGNVLTSVRVYLGAPAATGVHQALIRKINITDSAGVVRFRLYDMRDRIYVPSVGALTNYAFPFPYVEDVQSRGSQMAYSATRRRFEGEKTGRLLRVRMDLYNKTEIGGLYVDSAQVGTE